MTRIVARYVQQPDEKLTYRMDYSSWLGTGETIVSVVVYRARTVPDDTENNLLITGPFIDAGLTSINYQLSFGEDGEEYHITIRATTSEGQIVERDVTMSIEET